MATSYQNEDDASSSSQDDFFEANDYFEEVEQIKKRLEECRNFVKNTNYVQLLHEQQQMYRKKIDDLNIRIARAKRGDIIPQDHIANEKRLLHFTTNVHKQFDMHSKTKQFENLDWFITEVERLFQIYLDEYNYQTRLGQKCDDALNTLISLNVSSLNDIEQWLRYHAKVKHATNCKQLKISNVEKY